MEDFESLYRFRGGLYVLYVVLQPNCVLISDPIDYSSPPAIRKLLPPVTIDLYHNFARISTSGKVTFATTKLRGLDTLWHNTAVDITTL